MLLPKLAAQPADPLLSLIQQVANDPRPERIDMTVGVYRDAAGRTPVMQAVKAAEQLLVDDQSSKSYLGPDGDRGFAEALAPLACGQPLAGRMIGMQTPGGTGALRLAADLIAAGSPSRVIWLGVPCWANHQAIFQAAGLSIRTFDYVSVQTGAVDADAMLAALDAASPGDAVLLQACCHNPTGTDPDSAMWQAVAGRLAACDLLPVLDFAYQGLSDGWQEDAAAVRMVLAAVPEAIVAYSCDKNFGLYRDRVGAIFVQSTTTERAELIRSNLVAIARASYSMPPDHGAAAVRIILESARLRTLWSDELTAMRSRIQGIRAELAAAGTVGQIDLSRLQNQRGMFSMLPLELGAIAALRRDWSIYMAGSGRISIPGLQSADIARFTEALAAVQAPVLA